MREGKYEEVSRSTLLPDLDLSLLQRYYLERHPDQYKAVNEFLQAIRKG
ncbi:MAG: hypothetical protein GDA48_05225 [Hormoscilla sp. GM102CHS1]|nr:hypothetical protein [Hormoscilla sp. GM102CHS1]